MKPAMNLIGRDAWTWHLSMHERDSLWEDRDQLRAEVERLRQETLHMSEGLMYSREEVERLRALCAARPQFLSSRAFAKWIDLIDAAGRGEGKP
jgi:hypothetical protein